MNSLVTFQFVKKVFEKHITLFGLAAIGAAMVVTRLEIHQPQERKPRVMAAANTIMRFARKIFTLWSKATETQDAKAIESSFRGESKDDVRHHIHTIDQVLDYWFGQDPAVAHKNVWMTQASSARRKVVDAEINERFGHWVAYPPTQWWTDTQLYSYRGKVAAIIVLDQFSRHVHRYQQENVTTDNSRYDTLDLSPQSELDRVARHVATELLQNPHAYTALPIPMLVFSLMPFRHDSTIPSLEWVQEQTNCLAKLQDQYHDMIGRFRKATNRRLAVLQDADRRQGGDATTTDDYTDNDILECGPFSADLVAARQHVVYKTVSDFVRSHALDKENTLVVSLSGGVDSMVLLCVLGLMLPSTDQVVAVHIDYGNRPESAAEADFLQRYCTHTLGGVKMHCRRIHEVTRGLNARRDDYERISRTIRYETYRQVVPGSHPRVFLGHHRGDLRENVLSNAHKGSGPLDLSGMTAVSWNDGVQLLRPFLTLEKTAIFDYAHTYGVPYFKDTTPHWSTRGKLRNKLLPLLDEIYGDGSKNNLSQLAVESDQVRELFSLTLMAPFLKEMHKDRMGISFATRPWRELGIFFWKFMLKQALHSVGLGMFSDKSVATFHERICGNKNNKIRPGWLQCRKDYGVYVDEDGRVFVMYPDSFPWGPAAFVLPDDPVITNESVNVGPWRISVGSPRLFSENLRPILEERAVPSMHHFLKGCIEYHLIVPFLTDDVSAFGSVPPLVFGKFMKADRPMAWKNSDMKIQETLPLLRCEYRYTEGNSLGMVKVTLKRSNECLDGFKAR